MKSPLKWVGGKQKIIEKLASCVPDKWEFERYFEPFCGGSSLFFRLQPEYKESVSGWYLSDTNSDVINFFRQLKDNPFELITLAQKFNNNREAFDHVRKSFHLYADKILRAAAFYYLNHTAYGGLYRVNANGKFNVPFGNYARYEVNKDKLIECAKCLQSNVFIIERPFHAEDNEWSRPGPLDFVYFDPPYYKLFDKYTDPGFGKSGHVRLYQYCKELDKRGTKWILTNSDCPFILDLYDEFYITKIHSFNSIGKNKKGTNELIIRNF